MKTQNIQTSTVRTGKSPPFWLIGDGKTVAEAINDINGSIEEMRAYYQEQKKPFPQFDEIF